MNAEQQQDVRDIFDNLRAIKGDDFVRVVTLAGMAQNMVEMLKRYDPSQPGQFDTMRYVVSGTVGRLLAEITKTHDMDLREITEWAERLAERIGPTKH
ncbi:hypothetical protein y223_00019 [Bordetella phage PY223]